MSPGDLMTAVEVQDSGTGGVTISHSDFTLGKTDAGGKMGRLQLVEAAGEIGRDGEI